MNTIQLYLNDQLVDLTDTSPIALTLQANDLANLTDRQSTFSNQFDLPKTANNRRICGYADVSNFTNSTPYNYLSAKYIVNGYEVITGGKATIQQAGATFKVQLTYGLSGIADLLGDKKFADAITAVNNPDFPALNRSLSTVIASQNYTDGIVWPLIDYGNLKSSTVDIAQVYPAFFTKTLLKYVQAYTGYTFSGSVFALTEYLKELIPFALDEYNMNTGLLNLPDIGMKEFLKDFMQRYFLTPQVDNYKRTVNFFSFDDLYTNKSKAIDWTAKFVQDDNAASFAPDNYGQTNTLVMKEDDNVNAGYGDGSFTIDNPTLELTYEAVTSLFAASLQRTDYGDLNPAIINKIPDIKTSADLSITTQPRILIDRKVSSPIAFTDGSITLIAQTVSVPYFKLSGFPGAGYDEHVTRYGSGLVKLLSKYRTETRAVILSAADVLNFDFSIPVYDGRTSSCYYVNKINNWLPNRQIAVDLVRM
jgi:hypothetical protein